MADRPYFVALVDGSYELCKLSAPDRSLVSSLSRRQMCDAIDDDLKLAAGSVDWSRANEADIARGNPAVAQL